MRFWQKWYFPANAVLYIVGEFGRPVEDVRALIDASFGMIPPGREPLPGSATPLLPGSSNGADSSNGRVQSSAAASSNANGNGTSHDNGAGQSALKRKHKVRLPLHLLRSLLLAMNRP